MFIMWNPGISVQVCTRQTSATKDSEDVCADRCKAEGPNGVYKRGESAAVVAPQCRHGLADTQLLFVKNVR